MNYGLTNRLHGAQGRGGRTPGRRAARAAQRVDAPERITPTPTPARSTHRIHTASATADPNAFSPISLDGARGAEQSAGHRLSPGIRPGAGGRDSPKLLGMSLNGTLRTAIADVTAGWSRQAFAQHRPADSAEPPDPVVGEPADPQLWRQRHVQLRHRAVDAAQPALRRPSTTRSVAASRSNSSPSTIRQTKPLPDAARTAASTSPSRWPESGRSQTCSGRSAAGR